MSKAAVVINETILVEWKRQAENDGLLSEYEYHIGMINPPLPYQRWKLKYNALKRIQEAPDYYNNTRNIKREQSLCNELGY